MGEETEGERKGRERMERKGGVKQMNFERKQERDEMEKLRQEGKKGRCENGVIWEEREEREGE